MKETRFQDSIVRIDRLQCALRHAHYAAQVHGDPKAAATAQAQLMAAQAEAVALLNHINQTLKERAQ